MKNCSYIRVVGAGLRFPKLHGMCRNSRIYILFSRRAPSQNVSIFDINRNNERASFEHTFLPHYPLLWWRWWWWWWLLSCMAHTEDQSRSNDSIRCWNMSNTRNVLTPFLSMAKEYVYTAGETANGCIFIFSADQRNFHFDVASTIFYHLLWLTCALKHTESTRNDYLISGPRASFCQWYAYNVDVI